MSKALGKLREYETVVVLNPELTDDQVNNEVARLTGVLEKEQAELLREDRWGKRKISFEVRKHSRGNYILFHYLGRPEVIAEFERTLRNMEHAIRFMTTQSGDVDDVEAKRAEVEKMVRDRAADRARQEAEYEQREAVEPREQPAG